MINDFTTDPRRWSLVKLMRERKNGMPAVLAEWHRRLESDDD